LTYSEDWDKYHAFKKFGGINLLLYWAGFFVSSARELGEWKILELIFRALDKMPRMVLPFGDDVSAVDLGRGRVAVLKADMLVGKTDVPPGMKALQVGRKAVVMSISDLAAKGVQPIAVLVSVGFPPDYGKGDIEQIAAGLNAGAREYGAYVLGGDTNETSDLIIDCLVFGVGVKGRLMTRSGAKPGDILAVTGGFGNTSAGIKVLLEGLEISSSLREKLLKAVYMPRARLREGLALSKTGVVTASIDSSDGLAWSLHELSRMSGVGFRVEAVPTALEAAQFAKIHSLDANSLALYGGEEYELVITVKPRSWSKAERAVKKAGGRLIRLGYATKEVKLLLKAKETWMPMEPKGWEHFKSVRRR